MAVGDEGTGVSSGFQPSARARRVSGFVYSTSERLTDSIQTRRASTCYKYRFERCSSIDLLLTISLFMRDGSVLNVSARARLRTFGGLLGNGSQKFPLKPHYKECLERRAVFVQALRKISVVVFGVSTSACQRAPKE